MSKKQTGKIFLTIKEKPYVYICKATAAYACMFPHVCIFVNMCVFIVERARERELE